MSRRQTPSPAKDPFNEFVALLEAYHAGKTSDPKRLKLKIEGIWQKCNQQEWTLRLAHTDPVLKYAIEEFNATITKIV